MKPFLAEEVLASELTRAVVLAVQDDAVVVSAPGREAQACDVLATDGTAVLSEGDAVLAWLPQGPENRGIVLGLLQTGKRTRQDHEGADELVIEARQSLTLKCGDGSITIRKDGKVLIKGKDLVSHAKRLNRIKGGAVQIN